MSTKLQHYVSLRRGTGLMLLACLVACAGARAQQVVTFVQQVKQAPAPISWVPPASIPFGTPLSNVQLNATSTLAGTFVYNPVAGFIPAPGSTTLSTVFSPTDSNYKTTVVTVPLVVESPGSSTFTIAMVDPPSSIQSLVLQSGASSQTFRLIVTPVGDFHQPVTLSCQHPPANRTCHFSPAIVRPTTAPIEVALTFPLLLRAEVVQQSLPKNTFGSEARFSSFAFASMFGLLLLRRRQMWRSACRGIAVMLLTMPILHVLTGCGSGIHFLEQPVIVKAASLMEAKSLPINLMIPL